MTYEMVDVKTKLYEDSLLSLLALSVYNPTHERLREHAEKYVNSDANVYAYKENDDYSGIVVFTLKKNQATVNNIATLESRQGNGIATKMLDFVLKHFKVSEIIAETDDDAVGFYRIYGFTASVRREINGITRYKCMFVKPTPCFCGHDCSRCVTYLATVKNNDELRKQSQKFYKDEFGFDIPLSELHCMGGHSDDVFKLCRDCPWMKCCKEKCLSACSDCAEYPCKPLAEYQEKYVNKCNQI